MKQLKDWVIGTYEDRKLLIRCREVVQKIVPGAEVILYGSRARGDAMPESDYDVLVLVDQPVTRQLQEKICHPLYAIERETDTVISVQVFERREWLSPRFRAMPFLKNVELDGVVI